MFTTSFNRSIAHSLQQTQIYSLNTYTYRCNLTVPTCCHLCRQILPHVSYNLNTSLPADSWEYAAGTSDEMVDIRSSQRRIAAVYISCHCSCFTFLTCIGSRRSPELNLRLTRVPSRVGVKVVFCTIPFFSHATEMAITNSGVKMCLHGYRSVSCGSCCACRENYPVFYLMCA